MKRQKFQIASGVLALGAVMLISACASPGEDANPESSTSALVATTTTTRTTISALTPPFEGDAAEIAAAFANFFDGTLSDSERITSVQDNDDPVIQESWAASRSAAAGTVMTTQAQVDKIQMDAEGTSAAVEFTFLLNGEPATVLPLGATAVKVDGAWKISRTYFCDVVALRGIDVTACLNG